MVESYFASQSTLPTGYFLGLNRTDQSYPYVYVRSACLITPVLPSQQRQLHNYCQPCQRAARARHAPCIAAAQVTQQNVSQTPVNTLQYAHW